MLRAASASPVPVFEYFTAFWQEVSAVREGARSAPPAAEDSRALTHPGGMARYRLVTFLERQSAQVMHSAPPGGADLYLEAQYVMTALADEVLLTDQIGGEGFWAMNLLEPHFFQTRFAGEAIFARIDRTLEKPDAERAEMAAIYLAALALGFRGRYRHRDDRGELARYRARLHAFVFGRAAGAASRFLLPEAYEATLAAGAGKKLRDPLIWWAAPVLVAAVWFVISSLIWISIRMEVAPHIQKLNQRTAGEVRQ